MPKIPEYYSYNGEVNEETVMDDKNTNTNTNEHSMFDQIKVWIETHPIQSFALVAFGTTYISYKIYSKLITDSIYKANVKTIDFIIDNVEIVDQTC